MGEKKLVLSLRELDFDYWIVDMDEDKEEYIRQQKEHDNEIEETPFEEYEDDFNEWFWEQFEDNFSQTTYIPLNEHTLATLKKMMKELEEKEKC